MRLRKPETRFARPDALGVAVVVSYFVAVARSGAGGLLGDEVDAVGVGLLVIVLGWLLFPVPIDWLVSGEARQSKLRQVVAGGVVAILVAYSIGAIPRTRPFAQAALRYGLLDGLSASAASSLLPDCHDVRIAWYSLGPRFDPDDWPEPEHSTCCYFEPPNWRRYGLFSDREAVLLISFGTDSLVRQAYLLLHPHIQATEAFEPETWRSGQVDRKLAMAHGLVNDAGLVGMSEQSVYELLGAPDGRRRFLTPGGSELGSEELGLFEVTSEGTVNGGA